MMGPVNDEHPGGQAPPSTDGRRRAEQDGPVEPLEGLDPVDDGDAVDDHDPVLTPRAITLSVTTVLLALLVALAVAVPLPYAISGPGPTRDTLGDEGDTPLIAISGAPTYPSTGELLLTTVSTAGGPGYPVTLGDVLRGWASSARSVLPVEEVFPASETREQIEEANQADMISSQENATVAALEELGYAVPTTLTVDSTMPQSGAEGVVEPGDVVTSLDGVPVGSFAELSAGMDAVAAGDRVQLGVTRGGEPFELTVTTIDDGTGRAILGLFIDPTFDFPVDVSIKIDDIGGPSAGTMFALGIVDRLTPADEANGQVIAGTGTMDLTGSVGPIGGIQQKLVGARRDGATWFLAPEANCSEVVGHVPDGLSVLRISTLHDAREAITAIGAGTAGDLPGC